MEGSGQEPLIAEPGLVWGKMFFQNLEDPGVNCARCCWCNTVVAMEMAGIRLGEVRLDPKKN